MSAWMGKILIPSGGGPPPAGFFASTTGNAGNDGSIAHPWDLQTALDGGPANEVQPGDTIWVRGGTYTGQFTSSLVGNAGAHIFVKQYQHGTGSRERVTIDGYNAGNSTPALTIDGSYTEYFDLEVICSNIVRTNPNPGSTAPDGCNDGIYWADTAHDCKMVNFVIHDCKQGPYFARLATNIEAYGGLVYYCGWDGPDRSHGHDYYFQNTSGFKVASNCIGHNCFDLGVQSFGANPVNNITINDMYIYDSGRIAVNGTQPNYNVSAGGAGGGSNLVMVRGGSYSQTNTYDNLTYTDGWHNWSVTDGYWQNNMSFTAAWLYGTIVCDGNTFLFDAGQSAFGTNTYQARPGSGKQIFVVPNVYETGRGHIVVFNWDHSNSVSVDVSGVGLAIGDNYEVRHSMDFYGTAVASGAYAGANIAIPMTGLPIATPINYAAPGGSFPEFAAFTIWKV